MLAKELLQQKIIETEKGTNKKKKETQKVMYFSLFLAKPHKPNREKERFILQQIVMYNLVERLKC